MGCAGWNVLLLRCERERRTMRDPSTMAMRNPKMAKRLRKLDSRQPSDEALRCDDDGVWGGVRSAEM